MNSISETRDENVTKWGKEFYYRYKKMFGKVIKAELVHNQKDYICDLLLTNESKEVMTLSGMTGGYSGEGPYGTLEILIDAGFNVSDQFVFNNKTFVLKK